MTHTLSEIARALDALEYVGAGDIPVNALASLDAITEDSVVCLQHKKYAKEILASAASVIVTHEKYETDKAQIIVSDVGKAFITLLELFHPEDEPTSGVAPSAHIDPSASVHKSASIAAGVVIEAGAVIAEHVIIKANAFIGKRVSIGAGSVIEMNVSLYRDTVIEHDVIIHASAVIGSDGFGYLEARDKTQIKIPQKGNVVIGHGAEIGACVCIDRATLGSTKIGAGVKVDNLVQIAHNCEIGENSIVVAQVGIAGSSTIGKECILAGQVGIADHCRIGDKSIIGAQAGIMSNVEVPAGSKVLGSPADDMRAQLLRYNAEKKLPALISFIEKQFDTRFKIPR